MGALAFIAAGIFGVIVCAHTCAIIWVHVVVYQLRQSGELEPMTPYSAVIVPLADLQRMMHGEVPMSARSRMQRPVRLLHRTRVAAIVWFPVLVIATMAR